MSKARRRYIAATKTASKKEAMRMVRIAAPLLVLVIAGCTIRTGDLTLIATKNIPSTRQAEIRGQFEASDCKVFGIPNVEEAIDRTIEKGNGNALIDAALYQDLGFFQSCFRAKGTVVKLNQGEGGR